MDDIQKGMGGLCPREFEEALELWNALKDGRMTDIAEQYFNCADCDVYFNPNSGYVFLTDDDYNTVMMNDGKLDLFISTPYNGEEGFIDELVDRFDDLHKEDKEYLRELATEDNKIDYPILNDEEVEE